MKKWMMIFLAIGLLGGAFLVTGYWRFGTEAFEVPVTLTTGEKALISGRIPAKAWVGEDTPLNLQMTFSSKIPSNAAQFMAEIVLPDADITPKGQISLRFDPSSPVNLAWKITPQKPGLLEGTLWVNASVDGSAPQAVLARRFDLKSVMLFGITAAWYRRMGFGLLLLVVFFTAAFLHRPARHINEGKSLKSRKA